MAPATPEIEGREGMLNQEEYPTPKHTGPSALSVGGCLSLLSEVTCHLTRDGQCFLKQVSVLDRV